MTTHTRIGIIGRLSKDRRNELGQRVEDGQPGTDIIHCLKSDLPIDDLLDATWAEKTRPVPVKEKPESQARVAKAPEKPSKSSLIKANKDKKNGGESGGSRAGQTVRRRRAKNQPQPSMRGRPSANPQPPTINPK